MYNNPLQSRLDALMNQRAMIDQQMQSINQMPPININNQINQPIPNFDFNGKWITSEKEIDGFFNSSLPMLLMDSENPIFYIKNTDGTVKKFRFEEIIEPPKITVEDKVAKLEAQIEALIGVLTQSKESAHASAESEPQAVYEADKGV